MKFLSSFSFPGLGEALFGTSLADGSADGAPVGPLYCTVTPRWDLGYEGTDREGVEESHSNQISSTDTNTVTKQMTSKEKSPPSEALSTKSVTLTFSTTNSDIILQREKSREGVSEYEDVRDVLAAFINLRLVLF